MASVRVRIAEGDTAQPNLLWDSVWQPQLGYADWALADADEAQNRGGLRAKASLHTSVVLLLFTDKRLPVDHPLKFLVQDGDLRGWWGDGIDVRADLNETELGSLLWVFERSILTEDIRRWVEVIAIEALMPLIAQKAVVRIDAQASAEFANDRVDLLIQMYGRDGSKVYDQRFEDVWKQTATAPKPLPFPSYPPAVPIAVHGLGQLDFSRPSQSGLIPLI